MTATTAATPIDFDAVREYEAGGFSPRVAARLEHLDKHLQFALARHARRFGDETTASLEGMAEGARQYREEAVARLEAEHGAPLYIIVATDTANEEAEKELVMQLEAIASWLALFIALSQRLEQR